jgi:hypothetical protein
MPAGGNRLAAACDSRRTRACERRRAGRVCEVWVRQFVSAAGLSVDSGSSAISRERQHDGVAINFVRIVRTGTITKRRSS